MMTLSNDRTFIQVLLSNRAGLGDSVVVGGLVALGCACVFEGWHVMWQAHPFDPAAFGAMVAQILLAMGGGVGAREFLSSRNGPQPPG